MTECPTGLICDEACLVILRALEDRETLVTSLVRRDGRVEIRDERFL